jgi:hypothetical protein
MTPHAQVVPFCFFSFDFSSTSAADFLGLPRPRRRPSCSTSDAPPLCDDEVSLTTSGFFLGRPLFRFMGDSKAGSTVGCTAGFTGSSAGAGAVTFLGRPRRSFLTSSVPLAGVPFDSAGTVDVLPFTVSRIFLFFNGFPEASAASLKADIMIQRKVLLKEGDLLYANDVRTEQ